MPNVKDGKLVLTKKQQEFYRHYFAQEGQEKSALLAGYSPKSAAISGRKNVRLLRELPAEMFKECLDGVGVTLPAIARCIERNLNGGNGKVELIAARMGLAAYGIGATGAESPQNQTFNIQGPVMILQGEDDARKRLREGAPKLEPAQLKIEYANPIQRDFIWNTATESAFDGGVGNGKTTGGLFRLLILATEFPGSRWVVARKYWVDLERTTQKTFFEKVCPREWYDPKRGGRNVLGKTKLINGSEILWLHLDTMDERSLMSLEINGAFIDQAEEIEASMYEMLESRVGRWSRPDWGKPCPRYTWIASNPNGHDWIYYRFHPDCRPAANRQYFFATTIENLETLRKVNPDYVDNLLAKPETWKARWVYGNREIFEGQIHRGFSRKLHVYDHKQFDVLQSRPITGLFGYFDYGLSAPTAMLIVAADKEGYRWVLDEYYSANKKISEHAADLKKFMDKWKSAFRKIEWIKADPSCFYTELRDREGPQSIAQDYATHGLYFIEADNNEDTAIERINELLHKDDNRLNPILKDRGSPLLFVSDTCLNLIEELPNQRWKQKRNVLTGETEFVEERDPNLADHAYDCLRYMSNDILSYQPYAGTIKRLAMSYAHV